MDPVDTDHNDCDDHCGSLDGQLMKQRQRWGHDPQTTDHCGSVDGGSSDGQLMKLQLRWGHDPQTTDHCGSVDGGNSDGQLMKLQQRQRTKRSRVVDECLHESPV